MQRRKLVRVRELVKKEIKSCKGAGSRMLKYILIKRSEGVSERKVQDVLSKSRHKLNARFQNKSILAITRPIQAKTVQVKIYSSNHL